MKKIVSYIQMWRVTSVLKGEGYTRLGVNFESFNPTARGFWLKYFTAYTNNRVIVISLFRIKLL